MRFKHLIIALMAMTMVSCNHKPENDPQEMNVGSGLFVLSEGTYTFANSSLTYYDPVADTSMNNMFYRVNEAPIGDVGQSLALNEGHLYIVVNNSNYIYKVNARTMEYESTIADFYSPRHMTFISSTKAFVSDLIGGGLWEINPSAMTHTRFIETGKPIEKMVVLGNQLFGVNWSNYYQPNTVNNTVQVIDIENETVTDSIVVSTEPNSIVVDKNGNLWVMCSGGYLGTEKPALYCINSTSKAIIKHLEFAEGYPYHYPQSLAIDGNGENLYFVDTDIYKMSIDDNELPTGKFVEAGMSYFYSLYVAPDGDVYVADAKDFMQNGVVYRYNSNGEQVSSFEAGIAPCSMIFKD